MSKSVAALEDPLCDLADFLGISIEPKPDRIEGRGCPTLDFGVTQAQTPIRILASKVALTPWRVAVVVGLPGHLGLYVSTGHDSPDAEVAVLDRSHLPQMGKDILKEAGDAHIGPGRIPSEINAAAVAHYRGPLRGPLVRLNPSPSAEEDASKTEP